MAIVTRPSDSAIWLDVVHDAEKACAIVLQEELESYLVFLLMRYVIRPELVSEVMALSFLKAVQIGPSVKRNEELRRVGDQCLLLSGLYPKIAQKRMVRIGYFVGLGQTAYTASAHEKNDLYDQLGNQFVALMDVLQSIRCTNKAHPDLMPFEAWAQWSETGSQRALSVLRLYTDAIPIRNAVGDKKKRIK